MPVSNNKASRFWLPLGLATVLPCTILDVPARASTPTGAGVEITTTNRGAYTHELPTGRLVSPVGIVTGTPNFATQVAVGPTGVAVLANGPTRAQTVTLFDPRSLDPLCQLVAYQSKVSARQATKLTKAANVVGSWQDREPQRIGAQSQSLFQGLTFGPDGTLYAAGGMSDNVVTLKVTAGKMQILRSFPLTWQSFPKTQYPYEYQGEQQEPHLFYPDSVAVGPQGKYLYVTGLMANSLARVDLASGKTQYLNVGPYPFAVAIADQGKRLIVSNWGGNGVTVIDRAGFKVIGHVATGPVQGPTGRHPGVHPTALAVIPGTSRCWVADSNLDRIVEIDARTLKRIRVLNDSPYPGAPPGSYPDALAIVGQRLFVANAGNNDVAAFDLPTGHRLGLIPTGWYPTALSSTASDLYVVAAKGLGSGPNLEHQWDGSMMNGLIQRIPFKDLTANLMAWTHEALSSDRFSASQRHQRATDNARTTAWLRHRVQNVVFILRENKTFDEEFGSYNRAGKWADPHLDLFDRHDLPNLYHWADTQALLANFDADGETTAQGHQWITSSADSDFVQRTWPEFYSGRKLVANPGWTQALFHGIASGWGGLPLGVDNPMAIYQDLSALGHWSNPWISYPGRLFLFNDLLEHHVNFEDFGEFVSRSRAGTISRAMKRHLAVSFPGWDRMILDTYRAKTTISWLKAHQRNFPRFVYIWLPDDHTAGDSPCFYSPDYYVANNDQATAQIVHYLSTTPQWKHTAVFVTEDDAQSGADHIDAHRTFAEVLGPWVKHGFLDTEHLSQVNLIRTTEAILGLPPLSQWDASAKVLSGLWTDTPDFASVPVQPMTVKLTINPGSCRNETVLRREAGAAGSPLTPQWLKAHVKKLSSKTSQYPAGLAYGPTTLLKVPGPEQMRQEWLATKGSDRYRAVMRYLAAYAHKHRAPVGQYVAHEDD